MIIRVIVREGEAKESSESEAVESSRGQEQRVKPAYRLISIVSERKVSASSLEKL